MRRALQLIVLMLWWVPTARPEELSPTEYQIKAAFLFNFAKFIEWPPRVVQNAESPIIVGVIGEDPFREDLELTIQGKRINNRPLAIKRFRGEKRPEFTHILFIGASEKRRVPQILENLKGSGTLAVGDGIEHFTKLGGMINFVMEGRRVRFEINRAAAEQEGLKISSKLLNLAVRDGDNRAP